MRRAVTTACVVGIQIVVLVLAALGLNVVEPAKATATPVATLKPCANDEPVGGPCVWDGRHMGNGIGKSFRVTRDGRVVFITHRRAHQLLGLR